MVRERGRQTAKKLTTKNHLFLCCYVYLLFLFVPFLFLSTPYLFLFHIFFHSFSLVCFLFHYSPFSISLSVSRPLLDEDSSDNDDSAETMDLDPVVTEYNAFSQPGIHRCL